MPTTDLAAAMLRPSEAAAYLGISVSKLYNMAAKNELPVTRIRNSVRIPKVALDDWLAANTIPADSYPN